MHKKQGSHSAISASKKRKGDNLPHGKLYITFLMTLLILSVFSGAYAGVRYFPVNKINSNPKFIALDNDVPLNSELQWINIYYDDLNPVIRYSAFMLLFMIRSAYPLVRLCGISDYEALKSEIDEESIVNILIFNATKDYVIIGNSVIEWEDFIELFAADTSRDYVILVGDAFKLKGINNDKIHFKDYDIIGIITIGLFGAWEVSEILSSLGKDYEHFGERLKHELIKFFSENMGKVLEENINPVVYLGEVDLESKKARIQEYLRKHNNTIYLAEPVNLDGTPCTEDKPILFGLKGLYDFGPSSIDFMELPIISGLTGPIGDFIDLILDFLKKEGKDIIPLDMSTINQIVETFNAVKDFLGDPSVSGAGSVLGSFLDLIKTQFPYFDNYSKYIDLAIEGLFSLRGELEHILGFITDAISLLFPETGDQIENLKQIMNQILDVGTNFYKQIGSISEDSISLLLDWVLQKLANNTLQFLVQNLPIDVSEMENAYTKLSALVLPVFNLLTIKNLTLVTDQIIDIVQNVLGMFNTPDELEVLNKIASTMKLVINVLEKGEDTVNSLLNELISTFVPTEEISDIDGLVEDLIELLDDAIKDELSDINTYKNNIMDTLNTYISSTQPEIQNAKNFIRDIYTLTSTILSPTFDITDSTGLLDIMFQLIDTFSSEAPENIQKLKDLINGTLMAYGILTQNIKITQAILNIERWTGSKLNTLMSTLQTLLTDFLSEWLSQSQILSALEDIMAEAKILYGFLGIIGNIGTSSYDGILTSLMTTAGYSLMELFKDKLSLGNYSKILDVLLPSIMEFGESPSPERALEIIEEALNDLVGNSTILNTFRDVIGFLVDIRDAITDGVKWLTTKVMDWFVDKINDLIDEIESQLNSFLEGFSFLRFKGDLGIPFAELDVLSFSYDMNIVVDMGFDKEKFKNVVNHILFNGLTFDLSDTLEAFWDILTFFKFSPTLDAQFSLRSVFSEDNEMMKVLLESLGPDVSFEGEARFKIALLNFQLGSFNPSKILDLQEWYLRFQLEASRKITLIDFLTGGAGSGVLNKLASYIGLDSISVTIKFGLALEINLGSSTAAAGDHSVLVLEMTIGGILNVGIDIVIAELSLSVSLDLIFRLNLDFSLPNPLTISIDINYAIKVHLEFLFVGKTFGDDGNLFHYEFPNSNEQLSDKVNGTDADNDGLPDRFELNNIGFAPSRVDTDGDGLADNVELESIGTDPLDPDTDGDGLSDGDEVNTHNTNPLRVDTDNDKLTDYEEVIVIGTNPREIDTDGDGLDDYFEVTHIWDMSSIVPSVDKVIIGGVEYTDHTDPLDPDTDGDGLLDGEEGPMGGYYGAVLEEFGPNPIIFNHGYTHPLDNDTDDDSYVLLYDGSIAPGNIVLRDMTDKREIEGITVTFIEDGQPTLKTFRTSPVCPDTDQDTGPGAIYLNSDGYELSLNPPSDPLDNDMDDDGLIDGLEGVGNQYSNKTHYLLPDTDDDGLGDLQDILLGCDPRNPDTDYDMVTDGEEYLKYGTNPILPDSDFDGLSDGEELFYWHTNPMLKDSDNDGLLDGEEVLTYYTNPTDEDTDNDGLTDKEEVLIYYTNPFDPDSDDDGLLDSEEVLTYNTNPLNWDSDNDSITYPNEYGEMTWPMSDGMEVLVYGTNPMSSDTDNDGLSDSIELYLASGRIPNFEPIPLNVLDNDTDNDGMSDGEELRILNISDIIYPYISLEPILYYGSSPVMFDTDNDGLNDTFEVFTLGSNPASNDSDGDGLSDYDEYFNHNTSVIYNDTDYDGISDYEELFGVNTSEYSSAFSITSIIILDPLDPDFDDDLLPDGYELMVTKTDPTDNDTDDDGIIDGLEFDSDGDDLPDGLEFFGYNTSQVPGGGVNNPDTDGDGLSDGYEVYEVGTDPTDADTDGDGFTDGAEVAVGTDPLAYTAKSAYEKALKTKLGGKVLVALTPYGRELDKTIDVRVINGTPMSSVWFRYKYKGEYSQNYTMTYDNVSLQWVYQDIVWSKGDYILEVYGLSTEGILFTWTSEFSIGEAPVELGSILTWVGIGIAIGIFTILFIQYGLPRVRVMYKNIKQKKKGGNKNE